MCHGLSDVPSGRALIFFVLLPHFGLIWDKLLCPLDVVRVLPIEWTLAMSWEKTICSWVIFYCGTEGLIWQPLSGSLA